MTPSSLRRARQPEGSKLIAAEDFETVALLLCFTPVAWLLPERFWPTAADVVARLSALLVPSRRRREEERMPAFLVNLMGGSRREAARRYVAGRHEEMMATLREYRIGGWQPAMKVIGRQHLEQACAGGQGAILWMSDTEFAVLMEKKVVCGAGYRMVHLSRPEHGFSASRLGKRFLNPIETRAELKYLSERVVLDPGETLGRLRELRTHLKRGAIVSIRVGRKAAQTSKQPFLDGFIGLATGPVTLARTAGVPILPAFTLRPKPGQFEVHIEPPLNLAGEPDAPFKEYAQILAEYVKRDPGAWRGWPGWMRT